MRERQIRTAALQQADRRRDTDALVLAQNVPPGAELVGVLDLLCHASELCLSRHNVNRLMGKVYCVTRIKALDTAAHAKNV